MKLPIVKTKSGKWSTTNVTLVIIFLISMVDIWKPFIPVDLQVYAVPFVATLMLVIRTWFSSGTPIETSII